MRKKDDMELRALREAAKRCIARTPDITPPDRTESNQASAQHGEVETHGSNGIPVRRNRGAKHPNTGVVWDYPPVPMPERKFPISKTTGLPIRKSAEHVLHGLPKWYEWAMEWHSVTPAAFSSWRKNFLQISVDECAALLRVNARTIRNWERGANAIPFTVWYVMHCFLSRPDVWLSRDGFRDLYVDYRNGRAYLSSDEYPDIRFTHEELVLYAANMAVARGTEDTNRKLQARIQELEAANTELRRMFKSNQVTKELQSMHERIAGLLESIETADVYAFPLPVGEDGQAAPRREAAA